MRLFSDAFISDLVSVVFDGVIVHDGAVITDANERAAGIFGYESSESMVGLPYHVLLAPSGRRATELRVNAGTEGRYNALCRRQDGFDFTADVNTRETVLDGARVRIVAFRYSADDQTRSEESLIHRSLALDQTVKALATTIEQRDAFTGGHQTRVSALATRIAGELDMSDREITTIRIAGNIHDIGKIAVPAEILMKPGALSREEYDLVKLHPASGSAIINSVDFDGPVQETILRHHERLDGSGYPDGATCVIPEALVIAVADVYDALTSPRPYRAGMTPAEALELMQQHDGRGLDRDALEKLSSLVREGAYLA